MMISDLVQKAKEKKDKVKIETLNFYESRVYFNPFTSDEIYKTSRLKSPPLKGWDERRILKCSFLNNIIIIEVKKVETPQGI